MKLVGRINGPRLLQQVQWGHMRRTRGLHHRLVLRRIFVGLEEDFVKLFANRRRAGASAQIGNPFGNLQSDLLLFLDGGQRQGDDVGGRLAKVALARAAKVMR